MPTLQTVKDYSYKKIWGEHSLSIGELATLIIGILVLLFGHKWLGTWSTWIAVAVIVVGMILF